MLNLPKHVMQWQRWLPSALFWKRILRINRKLLIVGCSQYRLIVAAPKDSSEWNRSCRFWIRFGHFKKKSSDFAFSCMKRSRVNPGWKTSSVSPICPVSLPYVNNLLIRCCLCGRRDGTFFIPRVYTRMLLTEYFTRDNLQSEHNIVPAKRDGVFTW